MRNLMMLAALAVATSASAAPAQWGERKFEAASGERVKNPGLVKASANDAAGDTFGSEMVQHDVLSFSADLVNSEVVFTITFAGAITPGDSGAADAMIGFIDIDRGAGPGDTNGTTEAFCPSAAFSGEVDAEIAVFGGDAMTASFQDFNSGVDTPVPASYTGSSVTIRVPLATFDHVGSFSSATVIGTLPEPTDCAPDAALLTASTFVTQSVPSGNLWSMALLTLMLAIGSAVVLSRR